MVPTGRTLQDEQARLALRRMDIGPISADGYITARMWEHWKNTSGVPRMRPLERRLFDRVDRSFEIERNELAEYESNYDRAAPICRARMAEDLEASARRRQAELELADRIEHAARVMCRPDLLPMVEGMRQCRQFVQLGERDDGSHFVKKWEFHCGHVRVCPDEAREETQRMAERYTPAMIAWVNAHPKRRLQYWVLTYPHADESDLATHKRFLFERFKKVILGELDACPVQWQRRSQRWTPVRTRKRKLTAFPTVKAALVVQEDPFSAHYKWNVHLNVIVGIEGPIDFTALRSAWGAHAWFEKRSLPTDPAKLQRTLLELVKYSACHTGDKSARKYADGESEAPPMTKWPPSVLVEWLDAQGKRQDTDKGPRRIPFRRTRSYGDFHGLGWEKPEFSTENVRWIASASYDAETRTYCVTSILGYNFSGSRRATDNFMSPEAWYAKSTDPP